MLLGFTDGLLLASNVGFILKFIDDGVIGYTVGVPVRFIFGIDEWSVMGSLVGLSDVSNEGNAEGALLGKSLVSYGWCVLFLLVVYLMKLNILCM